VVKFLNKNGLTKQKTKQKNTIKEQFLHQCKVVVETSVLWWQRHLVA